MEVHAELLTRTKMFCGCLNEFGGEVNTRVCPVCLGLPGSLPVANRVAVEFVLKTALALNCNIAKKSYFHRKNYFYPDLPKGYQISQYEETNPIGYHGHLLIKYQGETKKIRIRRVHLEEDTGKLMHLPRGGSGIDFNRSGVPLMEIVTDYPPDIHSPEEAREYLHQLRLTLLYLGVCDGRMEQGSFRCEPNISIAPENSSQLGIKTELKNLSSFRSVTMGIEFEAKRMEEILRQGGTLTQETRGWDEANERSYPMRSKEHEHDYRYFTDPDLPPLVFSDEYIESIRARLPELPFAKHDRYTSQLKLSDYDASVLVNDPDKARYFDEVVTLGADPKIACNWLTGDLSKLLNEKNITVYESNFTPAHLADLVKSVQEGVISGKQAKDVLEDSFSTGTMPSTIITENGLAQVKDSLSLLKLVQEVLSENPDAVEKYRAGKLNIKGYLIGQAMKKSNGRANPQLLDELMMSELSK